MPGASGPVKKKKKTPKRPKNPGRLQTEETAQGNAENKERAAASSPNKQPSSVSSELDAGTVENVELVLGRINISDRKAIKAVQDRAQRYVDNAAEVAAQLDWKEREDGQRYKFHHLCYAGDEPGQVKMLIQDGLAPLAALTEGGQTPLHWGVLGGHLLVVDLLLAGGADPCAVDKRGMTPVHLASAKGHVKVLRSLLLAGADKVIDRQAAQLRDTAIAMACASGHLECVKVLREFGADIGLWSVTAENVVDIARRYGHTKIVEFLLQDMEAEDAANYLKMLRDAEERHRRLQQELVERYALERAVRHEQELAWIAADLKRQAKLKAEAEIRRKEYLRVARELRERNAREYVAKSRRWCNLNQARRAQFELFKAMEKERLLDAEVAAERQMREIWRRRTHSRMKRAEFLRHSTDVRNTQFRDKRFALETDGRDLTRQRGLSATHNDGHSAKALITAVLDDGLLRRNLASKSKAADIVESTRAEALHEVTDGVTFEESVATASETARSTRDGITSDSQRVEAQRHPPQRALTASAMLMASVGGRAVSSSSDGLGEHSAPIETKQEPSEEELAARRQAEAEAAEAAEAQRKAKAAAAAKAAFHAVVRIGVSTSTSQSAAALLVGAPSLPAFLTTAIETTGPGNNFVEAPSGASLSTASPQHEDCFQSCKATRQRSVGYRAAVRDHLKWRQFNQDTLALPTGAFGSNPVLPPSTRSLLSQFRQ